MHRLGDYFFLHIFLFFSMVSCSAEKPPHIYTSEDSTKIIMGAEQVQLYYPMIDGKKVGLIVNQTSTINNVHIVDSLLKLEVNVATIFSPEHGFRGEADAGEKVENGVDLKTAIPVISLYGKNKKPTKDQLKDIEILIFDIQDVGVRFYTYISTLHYVMEAAAENNIPLIVLDRPNPNAHYIDGPILEKDLKSFVGMHPVPIVYGMTIGEYAQMINGEKWLDNSVTANLTVVKLRNYNHQKVYDLPIKPSPNLPNLKSILLYPSLCLFEGSTVSVGRGTDKQFQVVGHPQFSDKQFSFKPVSQAGAKYPKHENKECFGVDLTKKSVKDIRDRKEISLSYLLQFYQNLKEQDIDFYNKNNFFDKLAGTYKLREQIKNGKSAEEIKQSWQADLDAFKIVREKYLMYN